MEDEKLHQRSDADLCGFVDCFLAVRAQNAFTPKLYEQFPMKVLLIERLTPYGELTTVYLPPLSLRR